MEESITSHTFSIKNLENYVNKFTLEILPGYAECLANKDVRDLTKLFNVDHICWDCKTDAEYETIVEYLYKNDLVTEVYESQVNGRTVGVFRLNLAKAPNISAAWLSATSPCQFLELAAPDATKPSVSGISHIEITWKGVEYFGDSPFANCLWRAKYEVLKKDRQNFNRPICYIEIRRTDQAPFIVYFLAGDSIENAISRESGVFQPVDKVSA